MRRFLRQAEAFPQSVDDTLLNQIQKEFDEWWAQLKHKRRPQDSMSNWKLFPNKPITDWDNVEAFLHDRYPDSVTHAGMGWEEAGPRLKYEAENPAGAAQWWKPLKDIRIPQALLTLHNRAQGRDDPVPTPVQTIQHQQWETKHKPLVNQVYDEERAASRRHGQSVVEDYAPTRTEVKATRPLIDRMRREFQEWWNGLPVKPRPQDVTTNWKVYPDHPETHWQNVESFLKDRYPDSVTGADYGSETAQPRLEYELDPEAYPDYKRYYDPKDTPLAQPTIPAAMLVLHNRGQKRTWGESDATRLLYRLMQKEQGFTPSDPRAASRRHAAKSPNIDGAQAFYMSLWDPPIEDWDDPFAGVSEGMDYPLLRRKDLPEYLEEFDDKNNKEAARRGTTMQRKVLRQAEVHAADKDAGRHERTWRHFLFHDPKDLPGYIVQHAHDWLETHPDVEPLDHPPPPKHRKLETVQASKFDPLSEFLQWAAVNGHTPDRHALDTFAEQKGSISLDEYDDIADLINYNQGMR